MNVAVSGDRGCCLSRKIRPDVYLFAVANGFGRIGVEPAAPLTLARLQEEIERRIRSRRFQRWAHQSRSVASALSAVLARVNEELHARSGSHEDYVTAGVSVTALLIVGEHAYLAHIGSTAAYLARGGSTIALTKNDAFDDESGLPVLTRALGLAHNVEAALSVFSLTDGDVLVLAGRRLPEAAERLVITYTGPEEAQVLPVVEAQTAQSIATGVLATVLFYALLSVR